MTTPPGYRFLIQLVDAPSAIYAHREIFGMYGIACAKVAKVLPGSERLVFQKNIKYRPPFFVPQARGFTVFVPEGWRHADR